LPFDYERSQSWPAEKQSASPVNHSLTVHKRWQLRKSGLQETRLSLAQRPYKLINFFRDGTSFTVVLVPKLS